jgi:hypothetical protein
MGIAQLLLAMEISQVARWLTPIMWTGYILAADGIVFRLKGSSWIKTRMREFPFLVLFSVGVWLVFEVYNFHLKNWAYFGVPSRDFVRNFAYFWSFATIMPGVFETADLVDAIWHKLRRKAERRTRRVNPGPTWAWIFSGLTMVIIPLALPTEIAAYMFGFVWIGFFLLLDPINELIGAASLRIEWKMGDWRRTVALLAGGMLCGLLWELWNFQAFLHEGGYWVYTIPEPLRPLGLTFGQMPVLGLLGFPPFALELYSFYSLLHRILRREVSLQLPARIA